VNGNAIIVSTCNGTTAQTWSLEPDGSVQIFGMCMDLPAPTVAAAGPAELWTCDGAANQTWHIGPGGTLANTGLGLCLTVPGTAAPDAAVSAAPCTGAANQQWIFP
jgi:hypothetical protein